MKVSAFAIATLAAVASAAPIKVYYISSTGAKIPVAEIEDPRAQSLSAFRLGHPATAATSRPAFQSPPFRPEMHTPGGMSCGNHLKAKYLAMSNRLRQALGMPTLIPMANINHPLPSTPHRPTDGFVNILPFPNPPSDDMVRVHVEMTRVGMEQPHMHHGQAKPFVHRLHHAINHLGPWEGRAVAFVLGCGLGVLLRMLFVLSVVMVRAVRGTRERQVQLPVEEPGTAYVILPPSYSADVADEKSVLIITPEPAPEYVEEEVKEAQAL